MIIVDKAARKVLLTKEFRQELKAYDYRLPGGKVFDSLAEYEAFRHVGKDIMDAATAKLRARRRKRRASQSKK